ncbi:MAG: TonB-dependent receptor domain-containing protein [Vicinamibacterales bacterium]
MIRRPFPLVLSLLSLFIAFSSATFGAPASAFADTVSGRVLDPDGRAVANADVLIVSGARVVAADKTTRDGKFGPIAVTPGDYRVLVGAGGFKADPRAITVRADSALSIDITLALAAVAESVVVSAARVETPLSRVTDSVTVVDRAALEARQAETVGDALRQVPGMGVVTSGGRGAITSLFPRGGESDYTLVLVDGIEQNAFGGGFDAAHLTTADIDRVEIVRGPQSALFGDGAIGGIVQVVTQLAGPLRAQGLFEGGGFNTWHTALSASGSDRAWAWGSSIEWLRSDGNTSDVPRLGTTVSNDDYENVNGQASVKWSDRPGRSVRVDVRGGRNERGFPGPYGSDPEHLYGGIDTVSRGTNTLAEVGAAADLGGGGRVQHHAQFTGAALKEHSVSPFGPFDDATHRVTGRYQLDINAPNVGWSAGAELLHERANNTFITGETFEPVPISRSDLGLFLEARPALGDRVFLTAGVRVERIERNALEANPSASGPRPAFGDDVVWSTNPKVSAAWLIHTPSSSSGLGTTKIRGGAGTGIKPPTAFDIAFTDNPGLKPERSRSFDLGLEQAFVNSTVVADATYFFNRYDDLIVSVGSSLSGASRYRTDNIANASARGLETGLSWRSPAGVAVRLAWTFLHTEVLGVDHLPTLAPTPFTVGDPLIRRPGSQGSVELTWAGARAAAFAFVNGRGAMNDIEPNYASTVYTNPGYAVVTLGGSFRVTRGLEITGRILNAFDKTYEEAFGFPALGRTAMVGIRVAGSR